MIPPVEKLQRLAPDTVVGVPAAELAALVQRVEALTDGLAELDADWLARRDRNREIERERGANLARYNSGIRMTYEDCARAVRTLRDAS